MNHQEQTHQRVLTCIREGEPEGIKEGQVFEVLSEGDRSWEINVEGERYLVSKVTGQIRSAFLSPWFAISDQE